MSQVGVSMQFSQQRFMVDVIKASFDVGIQYKFRFVPDSEKDGYDGIMT